MAESFLRVNESTEQFYRRCTNLSYFDCSEEEMLWWMMGPQRLPLQEIIPISVVLLVIFLTGVAGNVAVCVVIVRHPAMHTATNYYLFSLALSDLLLLLFGLPNDLSVYWHQYPYSLGIVFCKLRALISEAASDFKVRAGSTYRSEGGVLYDVASMSSHLRYNMGNKFDYDIAVMKIAGRISIDGKTTKIVKLADADSVLKHGELMTVSGWGDTSGLGDDPSNVLKAATLPVVNKKNCDKVWGLYAIIITDRMVCAGYTEPGTATCAGDSGGPLIDENFVQHGVVSFGSPYCQGRPTVFASVANLRDWIEWKTGV